MRTVAGPAGRPGMAIGVEPASRSLTNTRAPAGRDCTLSPPGPVFSRAQRRCVVDVVGRRGVSCSVRSSAAYPSRATRMVYDPSASSRSASGVFPRGFPFTSTSASAGVDRISMLPVGARSTAPDAGRDGVGAGARVPGATGAVGAGLPAEAPGAAGAEAGRSTIVASTPAGVSVADPAARQRRNNPTDSAARIATTRTATAIGHFLRPVSGSVASVASGSCDGCVDHGRFRGCGGD